MCLLPALVFLRTLLGYFLDLSSADPKDGPASPSWTLPPFFHIGFHPAEKVVKLGSWVCVPSADLFSSDCPLDSTMVTYFRYLKFSMLNWISSFFLPAPTRVPPISCLLNGTTICLIAPPAS